MKDQLENRLSDLKKEFEEGQRMLSELDSRRDTLRQTMLRISGAIQVLEEILNNQQAEPQTSGLEAAKQPVEG
jgi:DNA transposition AAA+ family ATPase